MLAGYAPIGGCGSQRAGIWRGSVLKEKNGGGGVFGGACGLRFPKQVGSLDGVNPSRLGLVCVCEVEVFVLCF